MQLVGMALVLSAVGVVASRTAQGSGGDAVVEMVESHE
jgi:hypothetical protein